MTTSHTTSPHPTSDREALSALFDGELGGDAARFALKRLDHDEDWRGTCERWSLVGDLLRAQGQALLPAGFPARMRAAAGAQAPAVAATATPNWARWGGVGLAASVAMAALFFARQNAHVDPGAGQPLVATVTPAQPAKPALPKPDAPGAVQLASAGVAVAQITRNGTQRVRRAPSVAAPSPVREVVTVATSARVPSASSAMAATPPLLQQPIDVPPFNGEAVARPWPRAVLPQAGGGSAMVAGFGTSMPSFYPFEPRVPGNEDQASADSDPRDDTAP